MRLFMCLASRSEASWGPMQGDAAKSLTLSMHGWLEGQTAVHIAASCCLSNSHRHLHGRYLELRLHSVAPDLARPSPALFCGLRHWRIVIVIGIVILIVLAHVIGSGVRRSR